MNDAPERLEVVVRGRVQGVAFRWYTQREARRLGLTGWVRNRPDGSVRLVAEGPRAVLDQLWAWLAHGPDRARVDQREQHRGEASGRFTDFTIDG
ncbi:MAG: acylphosphatase [bacterium]|nr:acylphosphatase [bacterium]